MQLEKSEARRFSLALSIDFSNCAVAVAISSRNERRARDSSAQLPRFSLFSFSFFLIREQGISSLDLSFSGHRARRRKTEEARQTVAKRAATNGSSFFGSYLGPKNGKSLLLPRHCARFSNTQYMLLYRLADACGPIT